MKYVDIDAVIERICLVYCASGPDECSYKIPQTGNGACSMVRSLKSIPAADVRPVVHANWERTETDLGTCCICSNCGSCPSMEYKFCPYCGADMREVGEDVD